MPSSSEANSATSSSGPGVSSGFIVLIVVAALVFLGVVACSGYCVYARVRGKDRGVLPTGDHQQQQQQQLAEERRDGIGRGREFYFVGSPEGGGNGNGDGVGKSSIVRYA